MFLGQPETQAERDAEQRALGRLQLVREHRNARVRDDIRADLAFGHTLDDACLRAARKHKLGRGGAAYARDLHEKD